MNCKIKIPVDEILEHIKRIKSNKVFLYPCAGNEKMSKQEIERYLNKNIKNLDNNLKYIFPQVKNLNRKTITCFICVFKNENYAKLFVDSLNDNDVCRATGHLVKFDESFYF